MTDPVEDAARSAAVILAPELGANLPAEVEAAQPGWVTSAHTRKGPRRPTGCVSVSVSFSPVRSRSPVVARQASAQLADGREFG